MTIIVMMTSQKRWRLKYDDDACLKSLNPCNDEDADDSDNVIYQKAMKNTDRVATTSFDISYWQAS